jgi:hypothetical protein
VLILYDPTKNFLLKIPVGASTPSPPKKKQNKRRIFMLIPNSLMNDAQKNVRKKFQAKTLEKRAKFEKLKNSIISSKKKLRTFYLTFL